MKNTYPLDEVVAKLDTAEAGLGRVDRVKHGRPGRRLAVFKLVGTASTVVGLVVGFVAAIAAVVAIGVAAVAAVVARVGVDVGHAPCHLGHERHVNENQRLPGQAGMEQGVAAPPGP
jgi:phage-related minor tail protein